MVHSVVEGTEVVDGAELAVTEGDVAEGAFLGAVVEFEAGVAELLQAARPNAMATEANPTPMVRRPFDAAGPWPDGRAFIVFIWDPRSVGSTGVCRVLHEAARPFHPPTGAGAPQPVPVHGEFQPRRQAAGTQAIPMFGGQRRRAVMVSVWWVYDGAVPRD
jgi:hypothetical protein